MVQMLQMLVPAVVFEVRGKQRQAVHQNSVVGHHAAARGWLEIEVEWKPRHNWSVDV